MCTVVIRVPEPGQGPVRVLAVRDEDPGRPWRPLGAWWPESPQVRGIQDELAGGAWLAADDRKLAVLVNLAGGADVAVPTSRGHLVLDALAGQPLPEPLTTLGFHLVEADAAGARLTSWQGGHPARQRLMPGTHMVSHADLDDPGYPRIAAWLPEFAATGTDTDPWWTAWLEVLAKSARLDPTDPRALIRDNRPEGHSTLSLLVAAVSVGARADHGGVHAVMYELDEPGVWNAPKLV